MKYGIRKFTPSWVKLIPEQAVCKFHGEIFDVYQWPQEMFDGTTATFELLKRQDTVTTIAIKDDKIIVEYQTQPRQDWLYDYPGGRHDNPEEDELAAAKRELREETGMSFRNWKLVDVRQPYSKMDWLIYTFIATDFEEQGPQQLDGGEKVEVMEVTLDELRELAKLPNSKFLDRDFMKGIKTIEDLKNLPELYKY